MNESEIKEFLSSPSTIVIVGASTKSHRAGHYVPKFLKDKGFELIPVNPNYDKVWGTDSLESIEQVEAGKKLPYIIYRNQSDAINIANQLIDEGKANLIWFPDNVFSNTIASKCAENDIKFVQNRCPLRDYRKLIGN